MKGVFDAGCYAVIFTSELSDDTKGYDAAADRMEQLAGLQPGFLGIHTVRSDHNGISVSYWQDEAAIQNWRTQAEHLLAQENGRNRWYKSYRVEVSRVERSYHHDRAP